jgi:hypothetical protein
MSKPRISTALALLAALPLCSFAVEPVKRIRVYALPYYQAATSADAAPLIAVNKEIDPLLSSNQREDVIKAEAWVRKNPQMITPMALMALAIRLYDVDSRDNAVFWYYAAQDRYATMGGVLEPGSSTLDRADKAMKIFTSLAGPTFEGYAYCDISKQQKIRKDALDWVAKNTYQALFIRELPAQSGKRNVNLKQTLAKLRADVEEHQQNLSKFDNYRNLLNSRRDSNADEKYCWKS